MSTNLGIQKKAQIIFQRFQAVNPAPTTELIYHSPFELLVAVILSAQATDKSVNRATKALFEVANTPPKMLALGETRLKHYIQSINFYANKAKYLIKTCTLLIQYHQAQVPADRTSLEALPGVGRKTANVILNTLFGEPVIAVDTHIFRVCNRTGLAPGKTPLAVEKQLHQLVPITYKKQAHHWLILHGRYVCTARNPSCHKCLIQDLCGKRYVY
jgi:endonuclease III